MGASKQREMLRSGQQAPDFQLERLENGIVGSAELLRDGPVLLAFFKSTCPVCQMTLPFLERIHRGRNPGSMTIYGVSQDDPETTREFRAQFQLGLPMLLDREEGGYAVSNAYQISHVPSLFLLGRDGTIDWSLEGFNKREFAAVAERAGVTPFRADEDVPEWKAG